MNELTFIPRAMAVFNLTSSPNLKEPPFLSLTKMSGTFLEDARLGRCFVNHFGLLSEATSMACILSTVDIYQKTTQHSINQSEWWSNNDIEGGEVTPT